jgi:hypothetical protein
MHANATKHSNKAWLLEVRHASSNRLDLLTVEKEKVVDRLILSRRRLEYLLQTHAKTFIHNHR